MAGLDSIKHFQDGGTAGEAIAASPVAEAGTISATLPQSKTGLSIQGKVALDPTQTEAILAKMQSFIDEREDPLNKIMGGVSRAYASTYGPQALLATQRQQDLQDKDVMGYRQQMAGYRAAQAAAANQAEIYNKGTAPATGATTGATANVVDQGVPIPPGQLERERLLGNDFAAKNASRSDYIKTVLLERTKRENNVELDKLVAYPINGEEQQITLRDAIELAKKNPNLPRNQIILEKAAAIGVVPTAAPSITAPSTTTKMKAELLKATEVPLEGLPTPFVAQESSSGKADTSKPNYAGAQGPMQVTKDTFETYKAKGIIPKEYDLNDPAHGYASGILIINDLHKKYNGDINKIAAEYYGGPGAINADGSINVARTGAPDPKTGKTGPSVGEYINDIRKRMNLPPADLTTAPAEVVKGPTAPVATAPVATAPVATAPVATAPVATAPLTPVVTSPTLGAPATTTVPQMKTELAAPTVTAPVAKPQKTLAEIQSERKIGEEAAKANIENIKKQEEKFLDRSDETAIGNKQASNDYLKVIINKFGGDKLIAGTLNEPTWGNAIAKAIEQGVTTPGGAISMPAITEVLMRTAKDSSPEKIEANLEIARLLGQRIMDVVAQSKGSSSDKDWIAFKAIAGSAANGWDALYKIQKYDEIMLNRDKTERELYNATYNGKTFDYAKHSMNPKRNELYAETAKKLQEVNRSTFKPQQTPVRPSDVPAGAMYDPPSKTWWWKDSSGKDKHN